MQSKKLVNMKITARIPSAWPMCLSSSSVQWTCDPAQRELWG